MISWCLHTEYTSSRQTTEIKQCWAHPVLWWVTTWCCTVGFLPDLEVFSQSVHMSSKPVGAFWHRKPGICFTHAFFSWNNLRSFIFTTGLCCEQRSACSVQGGWWLCMLLLPHPTHCGTEGCFTNCKLQQQLLWTVHFYVSQLWSYMWAQKRFVPNIKGDMGMEGWVLPCNPTPTNCRVVSRLHSYAPFLNLEQIFCVHSFFGRFVKYMLCSSVK